MENPSSTPATVAFDLDGYDRRVRALLALSLAAVGLGDIATELNELVAAAQGASRVGLDRGAVVS